MLLLTDLVTLDVLGACLIVISVTVYLIGEMADQQTIRLTYLLTACVSLTNLE